METPHLNRLEREGASYFESFVPTSVCSPSRASLLTGTYPHTHGVLINDLGTELHNLIGAPEYAEVTRTMQGRLEQQLSQTGYPATVAASD